MTPWTVVTWKHANCGGVGLVLNAGRWEGPPAFGLKPGDEFFSLATGPTPWGTGSWGPFPASCVSAARPLAAGDSWPYSGCPSERWTALDLYRQLRQAGPLSNDRMEALAMAIAAAVPDDLG